MLGRVIVDNTELMSTRTLALAYSFTYGVAVYAIDAIVVEKKKSAATKNGGKKGESHTAKTISLLRP